MVLKFIAFGAIATWGFALIWIHAGFPVALGVCLIMIATEVKE